MKDEEIDRVASTASIRLTEEEKKLFKKDMENILEWFSRLDEIDTQDTEPAFHPIDVKNEMREDKVEESLDRDEAMKNTKNKEDGFFKGPRIR